MKRIIVIFIILITFQLGVLAQSSQSRNVLQLRKEYVISKVQLSPEQGSRFWPLYDRYHIERRALRTRYKDKYLKENSRLDNHTANKMIDDNITYKEQELELLKKYQVQFLQILNSQQLADLYMAEREFKQMLINQVHLKK